jgi:hypothetical protein
MNSHDVLLEFWNKEISKQGIRMDSSVNLTDPNSSDTRANSKSNFLSLNKRKSLMFSNPNDLGMLKYKQNESVLSYLFIIYLFSQDDGIISNKEKSIIKKTLKKDGEILSQSHYEQIIQFVKDLPSISYITSYIETNDLKKAMVEEALNRVNKLFKSNSKYTVYFKKLSSDISNLSL